MMSLVPIDVNRNCPLEAGLGVYVLPQSKWRKQSRCRIITNLTFASSSFAKEAPAGGIAKCITPNEKSTNNVRKGNNPQAFA